VLIVGASATGIQLADEIHRAGRPVTIAAGHHTRMPRRYRGRDIMWWLDRSGMLDATPDDVYDVDISRGQPSLQLVGRPDHSTLDLGMLQARGVRVVGRFTRADGQRLHFADDLVATTAASDAKLAMLLWRLDNFAREHGLDERGIDEAFRPMWPQFVSAPTALDARDADIRTVIWATGYRRSYPWLEVPVLDGRGEIRHRGGVTEAPGMYVLGLQFLRRRNSNFIDGVGRDAREIAFEIAGHLGAAFPLNERYIA
jgi:putative flavoprotein involved in K+ transport